MPRYPAVAALLAILLLLPAAPLRGQTLKAVGIGVGQDPDRLFASSMFSSRLAQNLVYDCLVQMDDQLRPIPRLAAEVPTLDNGLARFVGSGEDRHLEVTLPLRAGVSWSDGTPFTADDVVYQFELIMNPGSGWDTTHEDRIKSVVKVDDLTVQIVYYSAREAKARDPRTYQNQGTDPVVDPRYLFGFNASNCFVYPRHKLRDLLGDDPRHSPNVAALGTSDLARNPVGTGPYVLESWDAGVLSFVSRGQASPQRQGAPKIDRVVLRTLATKDDHLAALEAGDIQAVASDVLDASDDPALQSLGAVQVIYVNGTTWEHLDFNLDNPILADAAVRKAVAVGIDRQAIVDTALHGLTEPAMSPVPAWSWAFNTGVPRYDFNPALAEELLGKAGWTRGPDGVRAKNGQRLSLRYWTTAAAFRPALAELVKEQLRRVGIEVRPELVPASMLFDPKASSPQALASRQFDLAQFAWAGAYDPGLDLGFVFHSGMIPAAVNGYSGGNYAGFRNARGDQLLDQGLLTLDPTVRRAAYGEAQVIWQTELPVLPLFARPTVGVASRQLTGYRPTMDRTGETWNIETWDLTP